MKAVSYASFGPPEVLDYKDHPRPEPGPGEVRIALRAASLIPADVKLRAGLLSHIFPVRLPKIPGRDGSGVVDAVGQGVHDLSPGDRVCVVAQHMQDGTHAEFVVLERSAIVPLPAELDFAQGAALMHAGVCAWICMVETAGVSPGMRVLIHGGAGAIGGAAIQIARAHGAEILSTCSSRNLAYVTALGADRAIAYDHEDFAAVAGKVDAVIDLIGGETAAASWQCLHPGGHMVSLIAKPFADRSAEFGVTLTFPKIHDRQDTLQAVVAAARAGDIRPQIAHRLPLREAAEAHRLLETGQVSRGRLVLDI